MRFWYSAIVLLTLSGTGLAQTPAPRSVSSADQLDSSSDRPASRVTDAKFWLTAVSLNVAMAIDTKTTFDVAHRCPQCVEADPYAQPFVARGPVVAFTAGETFDIGVMVLAAKMKGSDHPLYRRTWWVIPLALTAGHVLAAEHNTHVR